VPKLATDKTMFWPAADIEGRWKENEALKRNNSRLFDGPTNISANVRIVAGEDVPLTHETTSDLWIVTAGTAVARTDGRLENGATSISNATVRTVRTGDVLYVPPGVAHHFTEMKGFRAWLMRFDTLGLERTKPAPAANAQGGGAGGGRGAAGPPIPTLSTDKTMFWPASDIDARWQENERLKRINSRIFNGPANISANVRIVLPGDPPQTHEGTADLWLVTAGTAIARTDGEMVDGNGGKTIRNATSRPVHAGDLLYVPPGVPHHFTDMKGFRAWLIRYDVEGWRTKGGAAPTR
jgi:mannose-6-phosphate isomerase-like protein (cupin superfamily)